MLRLFESMSMMRPVLPSFSAMARKWIYQLKTGAETIQTIIDDLVREEFSRIIFQLSENNDICFQTKQITISMNSEKSTFGQFLRPHKRWGISPATNFNARHFYYGY